MKLSEKIRKAELDETPYIAFERGITDWIESAEYLEDALLELYASMKYFKRSDEKKLARHINAMHSARDTIKSWE